MVTYNRIDLLERCVDGVRAQSRPVDALLVINNGSTDDTVARLAARNVDVLTQDNVGSAGGWSRAIAHALENGFDAVWLMDDDGCPDPGALAILADNLTPDRACISSVVLQEDRPTHFVFPFPRLDRDGQPAIFAWPRKTPTLAGLQAQAKDGIYPFAHLFNGALVSCVAARAVGNVETRYFFFGDEVDYFMRLSAWGPVVSHLDAKHYHPDVTRRPINEFRLYYYVKNTLILNRLYFNKPLLRSILTVGVGLARLRARSGWKSLFSMTVGAQRRVLWKAIARGFRGQVGDDLHV
ncbi:MAG: glycosyltransferase [Brevundimonas sp.]|nr:glycosyltransferase [Brevundimonas sp.]MDI1282429.1 glycosyltransferase [Brevundimonas sp.]